MKQLKNVDEYIQKKPNDDLLDSQKCSKRQVKVECRNDFRLFFQVVRGFLRILWKNRVEVKSWSRK